MSSAIDLRLAGSACALAALLAACADAPKAPDAPAKAATSAPATRGQSSPSSGGTSSGTTAGSQPSPARPGSTTAPSPPPQPEPPPLTPLQAQLADGIRLFEAGEFYAAAGRLRNLPDLGSASVETQLTAMKYLAFSYCVTNRRTLCQQQFEAALKLDPKFELAPAERGHPIWKVHFERAQKAVLSPPPKAAEGAAGAKSSSNKSTKGGRSPAKETKDAKDPHEPAGKPAAANKAGTTQGGAGKSGTAKAGNKDGSTPKGGKKDGAAKGGADKGAAVSDPRSASDQKAQ